MCIRDRSMTSRENHRHQSLAVRLQQLCARLLSRARDAEAQHTNCRSELGGCQAKLEKTLEERDGANLQALADREALEEIKGLWRAHRPNFERVGFSPGPK
eukprot:TRINITY_DN60419_c0_g2_i1.p3 TRINITY_DN60419_c0_g2~~TRINITY_DN60419_c0_g2_i1.p3  ORF type:complete len:101 (+),score=20.85 TRINITY_DN60419_c0_g2_i1:88-390(+)